MRIILLVFFSILSVCSISFADTNSVIRLTVTQDVSRVFGGATDRQVDRIRLRKAVERKILGLSGSGFVTGSLAGVQVEKIEYLPSNKVEAVFTIPYRAHVKCP